MCRNLRLLLRSRTFVYCTLALSALYFVVTGIQFWSTEFLVQVIRADFSTVLVAFAATSATAPILGVLFGGLVIDSIGGYHGTVRYGTMRGDKIYNKDGDGDGDGDSDNDNDK